jgi:hypothetical protein
MEQGLINIPQNACKFAPKVGNCLTVFAERRNGNMREATSYHLDIFNSDSPIPRELLRLSF